MVYNPGLKFILSWPIIVQKPRTVHHLEVFLKIFYFPQYFTVHSKCSKIECKQNSTCEWCFWPKVYLIMINHCPRTQDCTPSGSILKNFLVSITLPYMPTKWSKTEYMQKSSCEWCTTLAKSLSYHDQSLSLIQGMHTISKYFKEFTIFHNTSLYALKMI